MTAFCDGKGRNRLSRLARYSVVIVIVMIVPSGSHTPLWSYERARVLVVCDASTHMFQDGGALRTWRLRT